MLLFVLAGLFSRRRPGGAGEGIGPDKQALEALDDESLMQHYARGNERAFEILLGRYDRRILNFIYRSVGDEGRAEELTQEVFIRVIRGAGRYTASARFSTWIYTIARNICVDESRRQRHRRASSLDSPLSQEDTGGERLVDRVADGEAVSGVGQIARAAFLERLAQALADLPDEQREVFVLRHHEGMRFVEIAALFEISENTVKSRMRYALKSLQEALRDFEGFSFDQVDAEASSGGFWK